MKKLNRAVVVAIVSIWCAPVAQAVSILVETRPQQIHVGDSIELRFVLQGVTADNPDFLPLKHLFDILYLKPVTTSFSSDLSGKSELSQTWELVVRARKEGKYTLPRIAFGKHLSPARTIEVLAKSATSTTSNDDLVFLKLEVEPEQPYVQQQMRLSLKLYSASPLSLPHFSRGSVQWAFAQGDALVKPGERDIRSKVVLKGREYNVLENRYWLFPQHSGTLEVAPIEISLAVPSSTPQPSPFDFQGFSQPSYENHRFASNALKLTIKPKPSHVKATPWLPAEALSINSSGQLLEKPLQVGQALSFKIKIHAQGLTAEQLAAIPIPDIPGLKMHSTAPKLDTRYSAAGASSSLEKNYVVIPERAGPLRIPELQVTWFNLKHGKEEIAISPALALTVAPTPNLASDPKSTQAGADAPRTSTESHPTVAAPTVLFRTELWFWVSVMLLVTWVGTLIYFFGFRKARHTPGVSKLPQEQTDPQNTESDWLRAIKSACAANQARECRSALIGWAQCVEYSLEDGLAQTDSDFKQELERLSARVYALPSQVLKAWDGEKFWRSFNTARDRLKQKRQDETLAPVAPMNLL